ncbi:MAG: DnaB-like helicase C-terminal domain-containing protein [Bacteroidota bacterium]
MEKERNYEKNILKQCFNKPAIYYSAEKKITADMFKEQQNALFWIIYQTISEQGEDICLSTVTDALETSGNDSYVDVFKDLINTEYEDEDKWKYHMSVIIGDYNENKLLELSQQIKDMIGEYPADDITKKIEQEISKLSLNTEDQKTLKLSFKEMIDDVKQKASGITKPYLETGDKRFDYFIATSPGNIILLAAQKGAGKTKFSIHFADGLLKHNKDLAINWHTYEVTGEAVMRNVVGRHLNLTERQIQSRNHVLRKQDIKQMESIYEQYNSYDVEFVTKPKNIYQICNDFKRFCALRPSKANVLIIDNLGLVSGVDNNTQIENDDLIAKKLVELRDDTKGIIIVIHHVSKESQNKKRMMEGYRLRDSDVRGSSRIADYANQVVLLNRPSLFPDLVTAEKLRVSKEKFSVFKNLIILDVTKNRESELGLIRYIENLKYCRFTEWP